MSGRRFYGGGNRDDSRAETDVELDSDCRDVYDLKGFQPRLSASHGATDGCQSTLSDLFF